ncbi:hypothetical protein GC194_03735 [bacterium]|nr:hypothetical protein [bacterium]
MKNYIILAIVGLGLMMPFKGKSQSSSSGVFVNSGSGLELLSECGWPEIEFTTASGGSFPITLDPNTSHFDLSLELNSYGGYMFSPSAFNGPAGSTQNYSEVNNTQYWHISFTTCCNGELFNVDVNIAYIMGSTSGGGSISTTVTSTGQSCQ